MFRGARRADLDAILKIYARARQAMADSGNPTQWGDHFPPQELLEEDIDSNRLFLYLVNGELEGVFAFILGPDPTYARIEDGKWLNDTLPYGTIHRLASAGRHPGVAAAVITWCLEHCESLRADTHADNKIMQHLLEEKRLYQVRHHPCGGWHTPHCLPENVPYPAFAPGLNRKNAPPHRKRWSGAVFMRFCQAWKGAGEPAFRKSDLSSDFQAWVRPPHPLPAWAGNTSRTAPCRCGSPATR